MKHLVILGAGTAGTMVANRVSRSVPPDWSISVVDPAPRHLYQPGLVSLPFGNRSGDELERPRETTLSPRVNWIQETVRALDPERREVCVEGSSRLHYDLLVIASGAGVHPAKSAAHQPWTLPGALALREALQRFQEGRLVVRLPGTPIKGPLAPFELLFLADEYFTLRGIRDRVELVLTTPLADLWPQPMAAAALSRLLDSRAITVERGGETAGDLLVAVPPHCGAPYLAAAGLADESGFVPTEPQTLRAVGQDHIFALGDATDLPLPKTGSVAHFQSRVVTENLLRALAGRSLTGVFDGHASCFVESGWGRALLVDGTYDAEPAPGFYPLPWIGPLRLLDESRLNHWTRSVLEPLYWRGLLPGLALPIPSSRPAARSAPTLRGGGSGAAPVAF